MDSIVKDEKGCEYKIHLCKTDLSMNSNKFYDMEMLKEGNGYWVKLINGRIGYKGVTHGKRFNDLEKAKLFFEEKFLQKTKLEWKDRKKKPVPGSYAVVILKNNKQMESVVKAEVAEEEEKENLKRKADDEQKLDKLIVEFLEHICNEDVHLQILKTLKYNDAYGKPIDCLSLDQIKQGYKILSQIEKILKKSGDGSLKVYINQYYSLIPHSFGFSIPPPINTMQCLLHEKELLETLKGTIESAQNMKDLNKKSSNNVFERLYERLPCKLEYVDDETAKALKLVLSMKAPTHSYHLEYVNAFEVVYKEEITAKRTRRSSTRLLLWHGTSVTNLVSILMHGLEIPEGPDCGLMFGNGVYFANVPTKSANYCRPEMNKRCYMLLCEVETRNPMILYQSDSEVYPKLTKSRKNVVNAKGKYTPTEKIKLNGLPVFSGGLEEIKKESELLYDEYVLYDKDKFSIKYVVEIRKHDDLDIF